MKAFFQNRDLNYAPVAEVTVYNPLKTKSIRLKFLIDTGFQGGILIPFKAYLSLDLNLFEKEETIAATATGTEVKLRTSKAIIEFDDENLECEAYTTLGVRRALLGREVLSRVGLLYNPPRELKFPLR